MSEENQHQNHPHRRTLVKAAAWTVPTITVLAATPAMAASEQSVGAVKVSGVNTLIPLARGFNVAADPSLPIPAGSTFSVTTNRVLELSLGVTWTLNIPGVGTYTSGSGGLNVVVLGGSEVYFALPAAIPAGVTATIRISGLSISLVTTFTGTLVPISPYVPGSGAVTTASFTVLV